MASQGQGFWAEFRNFAIKGNALDLAIAVVVGNAFSAIVNSLVSDLITPFISLLTSSGGAGEVKNLSITLRGAQMVNGTTTPAILLSYGSFIQTIINFFIIALSIFLVFKLISGARRRLFNKGEDAVPAHEKPAEERLLEEIRDLLKEERK